MTKIQQCFIDFYYPDSPQNKDILSRITDLEGENFNNISSKTVFFYLKEIIVIYSIK